MNLLVCSVLLTTTATTATTTTTTTATTITPTTTAAAASQLANTQPGHHQPVLELYGYFSFVSTTAVVDGAVGVTVIFKIDPPPFLYNKTNDE